MILDSGLLFWATVYMTDIATKRLTYDNWRRK